MPRKLQILIVITLGILSLVVILKTPLASKAMASILPGLLASKEPIDPYVDEIAIFEQELKRTDISNEERNLITEKFRTTVLMATQRAEGLANRPTRPAYIISTPTMKVGGFKIPDGIDDHPSVPISESVVTIINSWRKTTDERYFLIYAGVLKQDSKQGAILVLHPNTHNFIQFNTPTNNGGVKIIEENGTIITLQSTDGTIFYFDASQEVFIDGNGKPIPVNTNTSPTSIMMSESTQEIINAYP